MKKQLTAIFICALLALAPITAFASASSDVRVTIDGQEVIFPDQGPFIVDDRTLVPLRGVFEALGWEANWDRETSTAIITRGHVTITIQVGELTFSVLVYDPDSPLPGHGSLGILDVPAQIIGDRVMLPIRPVLESVGYTFVWDSPTRTAQITTPQRPMIFTIEEFEGPSADVLELIYTDGNRRYYLSSVRSGGIMLTFEDGTRMSLREALDQEKVTISDLIYNGLSVIVQEDTQPEGGRTLPMTTPVLLSLLEANGFITEDVGETPVENSFLSVGSRHFRIGDNELTGLTIYEFDSNEAAKADAAFIGISGSSISHPDFAVEISFTYTPHWFIRDFIIVLYVGEDAEIISFLEEHLELFAGGGRGR